MTLAVPRRTNVPGPTRKDPKDTPDRAFNKLAWGNHYGTEGVPGTDIVTSIMYAHTWMLTNVHVRVQEVPEFRLFYPSVV